MKARNWNVQDGDDVVGLWFPDGVYRQGKVKIQEGTSGEPELYLEQINPKDDGQSYFAIDDAFAMYKLATLR